MIFAYDSNSWISVWYQAHDFVSLDNQESIPDQKNRGVGQASCHLPNLTANVGPGLGGGRRVPFMHEVGEASGVPRHEPSRIYLRRLCSTFKEQSAYPTQHVIERFSVGTNGAQKAQELLMPVSVHALADGRGSLPCQIDTT